MSTHAILICKGQRGSTVRHSRRERLANSDTLTAVTPFENYVIVTDFDAKRPERR